MSLQHRISQHFGRNGHSFFGSHTFGQERRSSCTPHRLVILTLGLLNVVLLLAAAVIGIYCAKANDFQIPGSDVAPLIIEMNFLRNKTELIRVKKEAEAALKKEQDAHLQLKRQIQEKLIIRDVLLAKMEPLRAEMIFLQTNKTALEQSCGRCLPGWRLLKSRCYFASDSVPLQLRNWNTSRADCISRGGDLAVIDDQEQQKMLHDFLIDPQARLIPSGYWVGLMGSEINMGWTWINGKYVNSTQWRYDPPTPRGNQNCAAFAYFNTPLRALYHVDCQRQMKWICEMEPNRM